MSAPPSEAIASAKPDVASPESRKPQPLSRNFEKRMEQFAVISAKPTDKQVSTLAGKIASDNPEDADRSTEIARNAFENMRSFVKEKADMDATIKQARRDALAAPSGEFKAKVAALREAEQRRAEFISSIKTFGNLFIDAGVELDPSQIPLSLGEKAGQKAQEIKGKMATGASMAQEGIKGAAGYVAGEIGSKVENAKETTQKLVHTGREGLKRLVEASTGALGKTQEAGQAGFNDVRSKAETVGNRTAGGVSKLTEMWRNAREGITQRVNGTWEAASVWTTQRRQEITSRVTTVQENIDQMLVRARSSVAERVNGFNQAMQATGESARARWDETGESIRNFASEQAKKVEDVTSQVSTRVKTEVNMAIEKSKIFLEPARESIQRDRERIRQERDVYGEKLGIMVEGISDVASPIIDRILDEGRDLRDAALGFSGKQIKGLQVFGRNVAGGAIEASSPAWNFLAERWENLRLRANESRVRLNTFMEAVSGKAGNRFSQLRESVSERAKRTSSVLTGVKIEGGRVLQNGIEVSRQTAEWFVQTGTTAKEFLISRKEQIGQGIDMLHRYWEVYAGGKWKESGLKDIDIKRRMKVLRAAGAASLGRAASISAAAGIEGAVMLKELSRSKKGKVALSLAVLGIAMAVSPELRDGLQNFLSNVDLGGMQFPDLGTHAGGIDTSAVSMPNPVGVDAGNIPVDSGVISANPIDIGGSISPSVPDIGVTGTSPGPMLSPDVPQGIPTPTPDIASTLTPPDIAGATPTPDIVGSLPSIDMLTPGQPLESQALKLAGGVNETYYNLLQSGFDQFKDNFLSTAQAIVNNPSSYTPEQVSIAQQQLSAAARLDQDPSLIRGSQEWYDTIMKAGHFWRPA